MTEKPNVLVVCSRNKKRSRTAEFIFKKDSRFNIRSVGLSLKSQRKINEKDIIWSNIIFVMENNHKLRILEKFIKFDLPKIEILNIPDIYDYLDKNLIEILKEKINSKLYFEYQI